jgi:hypothetical protein
MRATRTLLLVAILGCGHSSSMNGDDAPATGSDVGIDTPQVGGDYDSDGPIPYDVHVEHLSTAGHNFDVTVYMPSTPGPHPAVGLSCGSTQTAAGYVPYGKRLASHGIAAVIEDVSRSRTDRHPAERGLCRRCLMPSLAGKIDLRRSASPVTPAAARSAARGGRGLKGKVVAWSGRSGRQPVRDDAAFARDTLPSIGITTTFLGAQVTSNCAPAADSYPTLYPLTPSPSVLIIGVGAGHTQLETADACTACTLCSPSGTADSNTVLAYAVRYFTAFFARELQGDASVGPTLDGAGAQTDVAAGRVTIMSK